MWRRQHLNLRMVRIFSADHDSHPVRVGLPIAWRRNSYFRPLSPGCNLLMSHNEHIDAGKLHPSAHALVVVIVRRIYRLQSPLGAVRQRLVRSSPQSRVIFLVLKSCVSRPPKPLPEHMPNDYVRPLFDLDIYTWFTLKTPEKGTMRILLVASIRESAGVACNPILLSATTERAEHNDTHPILPRIYYNS